MDGKKVFSATRNQKKSWNSNTCFTQNILSNKNNRTVLNTQIPNIGAPQYISQTLKDIKGETDVNTIKWWTLASHLHQWTD